MFVRKGIFSKGGLLVEYAAWIEGGSSVERLLGEWLGRGSIQRVIEGILRKSVIENLVEIDLHPFLLSHFYYIG